MTPIYQEVGLILKKSREAKGMTQLQVAKMLGYDSTQFVSLFERGLSKVPISVLGKLSRILEVRQRRLMHPLEQAMLKKMRTAFAEGYEGVSVSEDV